MKYCHKYELSADKKYLLIAYNLNEVNLYYYIMSNIFISNFIVRHKPKFSVENPYCFVMN